MVLLIQMSWESFLTGASILCFNMHHTACRSNLDELSGNRPNETVQRGHNR